MPSGKGKNKGKKNPGTGDDSPNAAGPSTRDLPTRSATAREPDPVYDGTWEKDVVKQQFFFHPNETSVKLDSKVTKVEDKIIQDLRTCQQRDSFPYRPAHHTSGDGKIDSSKLWANYFQLELSKDVTLYRYSVSVNADNSEDQWKGKAMDKGAEESAKSSTSKKVDRPTGKKMKRIIELMIENPVFADVRSHMVTDFSGLLISPTPIKKEHFNSPEGTLDLRVDYRREGDQVPRKHDKTFYLQVKLLDSLDIQELRKPWSVSLLDSNIVTQREQVLQCLNIFFSHHAKSMPGLVTLGSRRGFLPHPPDQQLDLGGGLVALRGFFSSVHVATSRVLLNVNVSNGAFYKSMRLDALMKEFLNEAGASVVMGYFLKGLRVSLRHLPEKNRDGNAVSQIKTIFGLAVEKDVRFVLKKPPPSSPTAGKASSSNAKGKGKASEKPDAVQINPGSDGKVGVFDFFRAKYGMNVKDESLPVVNVGNKEHPCHVPAQACEVIEGQPSKSKLSPNQTTKMIEFAVRKPYKTAISIVKDGPRTMGLLRNLNPKMEHFGLDMNPKLITVPVHALNAPVLRYRKARISPGKDGSWNLTNTQFHTPAKQGGKVQVKWAYLNISRDGTTDKRLEPTLDGFSTAVEATGLMMGKFSLGRSVTVGASLQPEFEAFWKNQMEIVLVILPKKDTELYNQVKLIGDIYMGLHTVCVIAANDKLYRDKPEQYFGNIALKFNLKLGGINHAIDSRIEKDQTMIVGIDVTHPSSSQAGAPSIAAMVANIENDFGQWPVDLRVQRAWKKADEGNELSEKNKNAGGFRGGAREEMVSEIHDMLLSRLRLWQAKHKGLNANQAGRLPRNILVYRDGVSEGQYQQVLAAELVEMRAACKEFYGKATAPKITIVVVGKRHHTRFFPTSALQKDSSDNAPKGTLVDRGLFEAHSWEFFLQSHTALKGTARPAHYVVIHDEIFHTKGAVQSHQGGNAAEWLENITHDMCYLFGRTTKAVSIPAPVYYADIACERARRYLADMFVQSSAVSEADGQKVDPDIEELQARITPKGKLKNEMFYI